jgi:hypothetical protein
MRTGELSFPLLMQKEFSIGYKKSTAALVWLRVLDLMAILLIAGFTLCLALRIELLSIAIAMSTIILPLWLASGFDLIADWMERFRPHWQEHIAEFRQGWPNDNREVWKSWFWTLLNWVVKLGSFAIVFQWFIEIEWSRALFAIIGAEMSSVLPIHSVAGAGTYESGAILGLSILDDFSKDAVIAAINLHLFIIGMTLITGLIAMNFRGKKPSSTLATENREESHDSP